MLSRRQAVQTVGTVLVAGSMARGFRPAVERLAATTNGGQTVSKPILERNPVLTESGDYHLVDPIESLTVTGEQIMVQGYGRSIAGQVDVTGRYIELQNLQMGTQNPERVLLISDSQTVIVRNCTVAPASDDGWQVILKNSQRCHVWYTEMRGGPGTAGILIQDASNNILSGCVNVSVRPLELERSHENSVVNCGFYSDDALISLKDSHRNEFRGNFGQAVGSTAFSLRGSHRNKLESNYTIDSDGAYYLSRSDFNSILRNTVTSSLGTPLTLQDSSHNRVLDNDFCDGGNFVRIVGESEENVVRNRECEDS